MQQIPNLKLKVEHYQETLGIGISSPRLSWIIETNIENWYQSGYEIQQFNGEGNLIAGTGQVESSQSQYIPWPFEPLQSRQVTNLRVRVYGQDGSLSAWSEKVPIEAGLLQAEDWNARFIAPNWEEDTSISNPAPYLRRDFNLHDELKSARLYITSLGIYQAEINGKIVGDLVFSPGWTVYDQHLRYQTYDITDMLKIGKNTIGVVIGDGWFRGRIGFGGGKRNIYGKRLAVLAQIEVQFQDGSYEYFCSDENWKASTGPILSNSIYDGESYDARLEHNNWSSPEFDSSNWYDVINVEWNIDSIEASLSPPVRRTELLKPISIFQSPSGKTIVDFGQNLVGRIVINVQGSSGHTITLRHAEVLENGELGTRPLRFAEAKDQYILKGGDVETWEPCFTFHGFRYVEVNNWPGELKIDDMTAVVIHSDIERTGWFETSDTILNKFHQNVVWSMRGNFFDIPTDCPQRDERLGWTGDIQVFSPTASFLFDVYGFLQSWLIDLVIEQRKFGGSVPQVVPMVIDRLMTGAAWADAATIIPWVLYQRFGDKKILADQFESMCNWVDHIVSLTGDTYLWDKGFQYGDWLDPTAPPDKPWQALTNKAIIANAYFAHSATIVAVSAQELGDLKAHKHYSEIAEKAKNAFVREFITPSGRMMSDSETAYAIALVFDLLPTEEQRRHAGYRLNELVRESGYKIRTGFVGTPIICDALCSTGYYLAAYRLLMQKDCPSWLYPVTMGATTIWERWDSMLPNGAINSGEMTSFNHYAFGAVADWMHRTIGGLSPSEPGYKRIDINPRPGGGLTFSYTRHQTPYGLVECSWKINDGIFFLDIKIPPNTTARVSFPDGSINEVGSGQWHWSLPYKDPDARGPFNTGDLLGEILSDATARDTMMKVLAHFGIPEMAKSILLSDLNMKLNEALCLLPNHEQVAEMMDSSLRKLNH